MKINGNFDAKLLRYVMRQLFDASAVIYDGDGDALCNILILLLVIITQT